ncbi:thiamine-phosphate kinase [Fodinisporobacter ferrooxydans]|uniref:Thiamine-monophosphate kinase n=1 Tax=Fodinisporobacter ferrooxydans TaxID=2901836 RepID=A0ABY4CQR9_9BACL|nr:thiamine-phosphate kinase [Alicyclobacillaceae bacterium MYW30-H2]
MRDLGEFGLIDRLTARLKHIQTDVTVGIGDDAAVLGYPADCEIVATTDALVEGVHFRSDTISVHNLGYKAVAASISDIAAMGGLPKHILLSLAIPPDSDISRLEGIYDGIDEISQHYKCSVVGGDVVKTEGPLVINVTLLGTVKRGQALLRSGAKVGDVVFVTGYVGGSAAGLSYRLRSQHPPFVETAEDTAAWKDCMEYLGSCHERPNPQVQAGQLLLASGVCSSCNDISDGLASELHEISKASNVTIEIQAAAVPIHPHVQAFARGFSCDALEWALYGGEDYQLVGTVRKESFDTLAAQFHQAGLQMFAIGHVTGTGRGVLLRQGNASTDISASGYNHFRS